jgi:hypothetical protein
MSRGKRKILIYFIISFFVTLVFRFISKSLIWNPEMLEQWFVGFFLSLGFDSVWENIGR